MILTSLEMKTALKIDIIDSESHNFQITLKDVTGSETVVNTLGYSKNNSMTEGEIIKYVFILTNLATDEVFKYVYSEDRVKVPLVSRIALGEKVILFPNNPCESFSDGIYKLEAYAISLTEFEAEVIEGVDVINNFPSAEPFSAYFDALAINEDENHLYRVESAVDDIISVNKRIIGVSGNQSFNGTLYFDTNFIISSTLNEKLMKVISTLSVIDCPNKQDVDKLTEVNLYLWAHRNLYKKGDFKGSYDYYKLAEGLLKTINI